MTTSRKRQLHKAVSLLILSIIILHYASRVLVVDWFKISGSSMVPTLIPGQKVWVNKIMMGPRIFMEYDHDGAYMRCARLPGLRKLRVGDVVVFNNPYGHGGDSISFKSKNVFCKRCWGVPGDTVWIRNCRLVDGSLFQDSLDQEINVDSFMEFLATALPERESVQAGYFAGEEGKWTLRDFGPIVVPKCGMSVILDSVALRHYGRVIDWENRCSGSALNVMAGKEYTFQQDWFFFVGDNYLNSLDSRHFGFVPASFVVGIVSNRNTRPL